MRIHRAVHPCALVLLIVFAAWCLPARATALEVGRDAHVFFSGAPVRFPVPESLQGSAQKIRLLTECEEEVAVHPLMGAEVQLGALPVGWYRVDFLDGEDCRVGFTTAAVLQALTELSRAESPIAIDVALAWQGAKDQHDWPLMAELAKCTGAGWVRDRIHWREVQESSGAFLPGTKYDESADLQSAEGLQILQVFHTRPAWAVVGADRPRTDLLKLYAFCKGLSERFKGRVQAWEPWNEGNAENFGGFTIDELCTLQKVACLGFKSGDPGTTVCWNPLGGINLPTQAEDILRNETWPYYDVYSIHSYDWPHGYETLWESARLAASGRPIWVTESDRGMTADPASPLGDFTPEQDRRKAEFVTQSYVRSLFSGASRHFHFILGQYMEGENRTQFGLLREDHTPRPSYVAVATLGRMLAGGKCLGRHEIDGHPEVHLYAFRAMPGGVVRDVVVAWAEGEGDWPERGKVHVPWPLGETLPVEAACDYLGRPLAAAVPTELTGAAVFLVLPRGTADRLVLRRVPEMPMTEGNRCPVVLQFDAPGSPPAIRTVGWTQEAVYEFSPGKTVTATLVVCNVSEASQSGTVTLSSEDRPALQSWNVNLERMSQVELPVSFTVPTPGAEKDSWIEFRGDFGTSGKPVLGIRNRRPVISTAH